MIPKKIHYCWFGNKKKSHLIKRCIESWKIHLPDYEIYEWSEKNCNLDHPFIKDAYEKKEWAFVSDIVRLQKLYEHGGIYLDTDMYLVKNLDSFLGDECFFGAELEDLISAGIIGTSPKNSFISRVLNKYDYLNFSIENKKEITTPKIITEVFKKSFNYNDKFIKVIQKENIFVYPVDYFYPLSYHLKSDIENYSNYIKHNTHGVHLWNSSWIDKSEFEYIRVKEYKKALPLIFNRVKKTRKIEYLYLRKLLSCVKESILRNEKFNSNFVL